MAERTPGMAQESGRAQGATRDVREQAREQGTQLQERVQEAGRQARDWAQETGSQLKEGAQEAIQQVGTVTSQLSDLSRTAMNQLEESLEDRIRSKPLQSVLIAAGAGMLLGLLWRK